MSFSGTRLAPVFVNLFRLVCPLKSFNRIINELDIFLQCRKEAIGKFQEATAYPITKERFRTMFREALPQNS
jgi:hypothetical protein